MDKHLVNLIEATKGHNFLILLALAAVGTFFGQDTSCMTSGVTGPESLWVATVLTFVNTLRKQYSTPKEH